MGTLVCLTPQPGGQLSAFPPAVLACITDSIRPERTMGRPTIRFALFRHVPRFVFFGKRANAGQPVLSRTPDSLCQPDSSYVDHGSQQAHTLPPTAAAEGQRTAHLSELLFSLGLYREDVERVQLHDRHVRRLALRAPPPPPPTTSSSAAGTLKAKQAGVPRMWFMPFRWMQW